MTKDFIEETMKEFEQYCNDGYSGGKDGLRCSECDRKYRGEANIIQLCPVCGVRSALLSQRASILAEVEGVIKKKAKKRDEGKDELYCNFIRCLECDEGSNPEGGNFCLSCGKPLTDEGVEIALSSLKEALSTLK